MSIELGQDEEIVKKKFQFDYTININHIIAVVSFLVGGTILYSTFDKRLTLLETAEISRAKQESEKDTVRTASMAELKSDIKEIQRSINDLARTPPAQICKSNVIGS